VWRGVTLSEVLKEVQLAPTTTELLFEGADHGTVEGADITFSRSLPLAKALDVDTLLTYELNSQPLPAEHGGPVRLVVPDWYGVASVKWLVKITALEEPFTGFYQ